MIADLLQDRRTRRRLVDQFMEAWQAGTAPLVETALPAKPTSGPSPARQELLEELVKVEMEYRWRGARRMASGGPKLEEYLGRFPELGGTEGVSIALIGAEYRIRHLWGDRPGFEEYLSRFRGRAAEIRAILAKMEMAIVTALLSETPAPSPTTRPVGPRAAPIDTVSALLNT